MNPDTNRFEQLTEDPGSEEQQQAFEHAATEQLKRLVAQQNAGRLIRPDGTEVPPHWSTFQVGEEVVIKDYTFKVAYIGETAILFEPVGIPIVGTNGEK